MFVHQANSNDCIYTYTLCNALCIAHCSQFEHSGDSTMQSYNV